MTKRPGSPVDPLAEAMKAAEPVEHISAEPPPRPAGPSPVVREAEDEEPDQLDATVLLADLLTEEDIAKARQKARDRFVAEERKARLKTVEDEELERLRMAQGLVTGERRLDELVYLHVNLAEHSDRLKVNGQEFYHGQTYKVTRAQADTLRDMIYRGWRHQDEIEGHDLLSHYRRQMETGLSGLRGVSSAPNSLLTSEFRH